jgi:uncharacterized protein YjiS (DUF1127 family)
MHIMQSQVGLAPDRGESFRWRGALATLRLWRRRVRERGELANMSPREWRDIGVTRADVMREVEKPFWR